MDAPGGLGGCSASVFGLIWHEQPTYALETTQPHIFLPPKHNQHTSNMLLIDIGCTQVWRSSDFDPFGHPFCCFF